MKSTDFSAEARRLSSGGSAAGSSGAREWDQNRTGAGLAIAVVLISALAAASPAKAETPAPTARLTIPDLPRGGSRFGLLIVGEPDSTAIAARTAVSRALVLEGHTTELIIPGLAAAPRREEVLRICAQHELDGLAFVSVRHGDAPARADVVIRDANGDPFRGEVVPDPEGRALRTPLFTESKATFTVPTPESPSAAEPRPAPLRRLPPLLWFDERDGSALLGDRVLADGEVYRLLGHPDLELRFQSRMRAKNALLVTGIAASAVSLLIGPLLWSVAERGWPSPDRSPTFLYVDGALLAVAVGAFSASWSIDPHPIGRRERFALARDFNAARLPHDDDRDDPQP
jgi:hypothetical protein